MKLFSRMLSKKAEPQDPAGKIDLDMDVEPLQRRDEPTADDSGKANSASVKSDDSDPILADKTQPVHARDEEPEEVEGAGWGENSWSEDDWDDDDDWGDDDDLDEAEAAAESEALEEKAHLVGEIRDAVTAVSHIGAEEADDLATRPARKASKWENDEQFGRKAIARSQLGSEVEGAEDRLLQETDTHFSDRETSRRRSAMAHLKAAAQATKADRVLKHVVGRDPTADPEEQSPYRDDLAKVVRPRSTSRPISRPVSRPRTVSAPWDQGTSDDDAAKFAAASEESLMSQASPDFESEEEAARQERLAKAPADLSADDFADDRFLGSGFDGKDDEFEDEIAMDNGPEDFEEGSESTAAGDAEAGEDEAQRDSAPNWSDRFASDDVEEEFDHAIDGNVDDAPEITSKEDSTDDEGGGPVASSVVSDVVAFANAPEESGSAEDEVVRKKISEMAGDSAKVQNVKNTTNKDANDDAIVNVGAAVSGRAGRSAGRVKTRLLGFQATDDGAPQDVFETAQTASETNLTQYPVGWIVVIEGPGRGACFTMFNGVTNIGRGEDQSVRLDFGDSSISRQNHAAVAFDDEQGKFFLGYGGKSNLVRLNGKPVLSTEELATSDQIRIGETTLIFIGLCDENFKWTELNDDIEGTDAD